MIYIDKDYKNYYISDNNNDQNQESNIIYKYIPIQNNNDYNYDYNHELNNALLHNEYLKNFDYNVIYNDLTPPLKRSYYDDHYLPPALTPVYNRHPKQFRKIGTLVAKDAPNDDKYKFLNLIGRERYSNRDFEYYVTSIDKDSTLKINLHNKNKQYYDGDEINISELNNNYVLKENNTLSFDYY